MSIFSIFLFFSQIDFLILRTLADVLVRAGPPVLCTSCRFSIGALRGLRCTRAVRGLRCVRGLY